MSIHSDESITFFDEANGSEAIVYVRVASGYHICLTVSLKTNGDMELTLPVREAELVTTALFKAAKKVQKDSETITFFDIGEQQAGRVTVSVHEKTVGLSVSLQEEGKVTIYIPDSKAELVSEALKQAIEFMMGK